MKKLKTFENFKINEFNEYSQKYGVDFDKIDDSKFIKLLKKEIKDKGSFVYDYPENNLPILFRKDGMIFDPDKSYLISNKPLTKEELSTNNDTVSFSFEVIYEYSVKKIENAFCKTLAPIL